MQNTYLCHYGVKGMKWGVRKDRAISGRRVVSGTHKRLSSAHGNSHAPKHTYVQGAGWGYYQTTPNLNHAPSANEARINKIMASRSSYTDFLIRDIGRTSRKLHASMRTNLYSQEQKIQIGQQMTGRIMSDIGGITMANAGSIAGAAAAAYLVSAAVEAKQRRDENN